MDFGLVTTYITGRRGVYKHQAYPLSGCKPPNHYMTTTEGEKKIEPGIVHFMGVKYDYADTLSAASVCVCDGWGDRILFFIRSEVDLEEISYSWSK